MSTQNIFLYWIGKEYKLISILRNLIYLHSNTGIGYKVNLITDKNVNNYIKYIPDYFYNLCPAHQADFVRVNVIHDYGGIWLDSDTLVLNSLDSLFDIIKEKDGFFIIQDNKTIWNGIFGSKKETPLMVEWKKNMLTSLEDKKQHIRWTEIGNDMIQSMYNNNSELYKNYIIFNGLDNLYPINWDKCVDEFIDKSYDNYKNIIRNYQPLIVLVNSVYKIFEEMTNEQILKSDMPLKYFINKSFENMSLIDYDFIEIGTSNFKTLIEHADDSTKGISVDSVKYYVDILPDKQNVKKINAAISNVNTISNVYYIPENIIEQNGLDSWFRGCNCINDYHPLHITHNVSHLCTIEKVRTITMNELFYQNKVRNVRYLKVTAEGHDCVILKDLYFYIRYLPDIFYPNKILFRTNQNLKITDVNEIIDLFCSIGYKLENRDYDTTLVYNFYM